MRMPIPERLTVPVCDADLPKPKGEMLTHQLIP